MWLVIFAVIDLPREITKCVNGKKLLSLTNDQWRTQKTENIAYCQIAK